MATIGSLAVNLVARTEKFSGGLSKARKDLSSFGKGIGATQKLLLGFGAALAAKFTFSSIHAAANEVDRLADRAANLHVGVDMFTRLGHAAKLSGSDIDTVGKGVERMNKMLGGSAGQSTIARLGLDFEKIRNLSPDKQFLTIGGAIARMESPAEKTALSMQLFGKAGAELVPMFERGEGGINRLMAEADRLGVTISQVAADDIGAMNDQIDKASAAWERMERVVAHQLSPTIAAAAQGAEGLAILLSNTQEKSGKPADWLTMGSTPFGGRQNEDRGLLTMMYDKAFSGLMPKEVAGVSQDRISEMTANSRGSSKAETVFGDFTSRGAAIESGMQRGVGAAGRGLDGALSTFGEKFLQGSKVLADGMSKLDAMNSPANHLQALGNAIFNPQQPYGASNMAQQGLSAAMNPSLGREEMMSRMAKIQASDRSGAAVRGSAALERGTSAAFSQERRSSQQNQLLDESRKQTKHLKDMVEKLDKLPGKDLGAQLLPANVV